MKSVKGILLTVLTLVFILSFATDGICSWWLDGDDEDIFLLRVDSDPDAPNHEIDQGVYGYYTTSQQWVCVLDFNTTYIIQPPFTWSIVYWFAY